MNKINELFLKKKDILSVYYTAGFPGLEDTLPLAEALVEAGVDMLEIGMPFSDPLADGPVIQQSSERALKNGMTVNVLFRQLEGLRRSLPDTPVLLMGYLNPVLQYGMERFCSGISALGIDGVIIPDLPLKEYLDEYQPLFRKHKICPVFLITPQTGEDRIRMLDEHADGFLYLVSSAATTGVKSGVSVAQKDYFSRIKQMKLKNPLMIGFGIADASSFSTACTYAQGAIIGSALIRELGQDWQEKKSVHRFIHDIKNKKKTTV